MLKRAIPTMFHRRLVLLGAATLAALAGLAMRAADLTLRRGSELRDKAEAKLVTRAWTPTVRGRILDRKGRVLAEDRPSFDLIVDYDVLSGAWAAERGRAAARRTWKHQWPEMAPERQRALVARFQKAYEGHVDAAWGRIADLAGMEPAEVAQRRAEIIATVERRYRAIVDKRLAEETQKAGERGEPLLPDELKAIERRAGEPIWEQHAGHALVTRLADAAGMALGALAGDTVELAVGEDDAGETVIDRVEVLPGARLAGSGDRLYPQDIQTVEFDRSTLPLPLRGPGKAYVTVEGVGVHVIGWTREGVQKEDIDAREALRASDPAFRGRVADAEGADRGFYDPNVSESVGASGIEASRESELRGLRGRRERRLDSGEVKIDPPTQGGDVMLTMDSVLQARVQGAMSPELGLGVVQPWHGSHPTTVEGAPDPAYRPNGTVLNGAAVVMEIDSGDILAMVSTPTFSRRDLRENPELVFGDALRAPSLNRAIARIYPPGSVAKAMMLVEAAKQGKYAIGDTVDCTGHLFPNNENAFRCWIFKRSQNGARYTHTAILGHPLNGSEGLMVSCNIFFFTMGQRLGVAGIARAYEDFGVGAGFGLGIGPEFAGVVGTLSPAFPKGDRTKLEIQDAIQMGIGQGPVAWTPLHAADAYCTIARMGVKVSPRLVRDGRSQTITRLGLDPAVCAEALEGLGRSVNEEWGTGHHLTHATEAGNVQEPTFNAKDVWVWGKTGTASGVEKIDPDGDGPLPVQRIEGDHSWYVILVGRPSDHRPRFAVAVLMEYAGSGGKVSGPIANQIVHALIAEGYL